MVLGVMYVDRDSEFVRQLLVNRADVRKCSCDCLDREALPRTNLQYKGIKGTPRPQYTWMVCIIEIGIVEVES